jgi:hypothetical protein
MTFYATFYKATNINQGISDQEITKTYKVPWITLSNGTNNGMDSHPNQF